MLGSSRRERESKKINESEDKKVVANEEEETEESCIPVDKELRVQSLPLLLSERIITVCLILIIFPSVVEFEHGMIRQQRRGPRGRIG